MERIDVITSASSLPWKSASPVAISATIVPQLHTSTSSSYVVRFAISSGARYQREPT